MLQKQQQLIYYTSRRLNFVHISTLPLQLAGLLWRLNFVHITKVIQVPKFIAHLSHSVLGWMLESKPPKNFNTPIGATLEIQQQQHLDQLEQQLIWQSISQQNGGQELGNINAAQVL